MKCRVRLGRLLTDRNKQVWFSSLKNVSFFKGLRFCDLPLQTEINKVSCSMLKRSILNPFNEFKKCWFSNNFWEVFSILCNIKRGWGLFLDILIRVSTFELEHHNWVEKLTSSSNVIDGWFLQSMREQIERLIQFFCPKYYCNMS
jgi:hypothetical protein